MNCRSDNSVKIVSLQLLKNDNMIKRTKASIPKLIIHKIGNKFNDTRNIFSEEPVVFDEDSYKSICDKWYIKYPEKQNYFGKFLLKYRY